MNQAMAALLAPFGNCVDVLNPTVFQPLLVDGLKMTFNYAKNLDNTEFKDKVCHIILHSCLDLFVVISLVRAYCTIEN